MAPEMLRGEPYREKCDVFSLGSVMFNLLSGLYLFSGDNSEEVLKSNIICDLS